MLPTVETWREHLEDEELINYVLDEGEGRRGFVSYSLAEEVLTVEELVGESPRRPPPCGPSSGPGPRPRRPCAATSTPETPGGCIFGGMPEVDVREHVWMLRVVDLPGAMAARGFSPHVTASAEIAPRRPGGSRELRRRWSSRSQRGREGPKLSTRSEGDADPAPIESAASAERAQRHTESVVGQPGWDRAGWRASGAAGPCRGSEQPGLASGGAQEADRALDAMFACTPFMTEYF